MRRGQIEILMREISAQIRELCFSPLDMETKQYVEHEMSYCNNHRAAVVAWLIIVLEAWNMIRVLFFSKSGLSSPNNQRYFAMYLGLLISGVICLILREKLQRNREALQEFYSVFALFLLMWHGSLAAMDLQHNPNITVFVTGSFVVAIIIRLKPWQSFCVFPTGLLLLLVGGGKAVSGGILINASIVTVVAVLISCSRYMTMIEEMGYRKKMVLQADRSLADNLRIKVILAQRDALLTYSKGLVFIWDATKDSLFFSPNSAVSEEEQQIVLDWLKNSGSHSVSGNICLKKADGKKDAQFYQIKITPQKDENEQLMGAIGRITRYRALERQICSLGKV